MLWNRRSWTFHISVQILKYICASSQFSSPNSSSKCLHSSSSPRKKSAKVHLSSRREAVKLANDVKQKTNVQKKENKDWKHQLKTEQRKRCKILKRNETQRSNMKEGKIRRFSAHFICHPLGIWRCHLKLNRKKTRKRQTHVGKLKTLKALSVLTLNVSGHVLSEAKKGLLK